MTTEEKAKAYDEALKKMKRMRKSWETLSYNGKTFLQDLYSIFPQLAESEDEKIRNEIIESIKGNMSVIHKDKCIAWLEKQDAQTIKETLRTEYEKGRADVIAEIQNTVWSEEENE